MRRYLPPRKDLFPAPEAQWPVEASIVLEDQVLFERAIESINTVSASIFRRIGKAMFLFELPTTHAQYVSNIYRRTVNFPDLKKFHDI